MNKVTVALAGNPNVGKSTLFNALTGMRQHTGNWPGKTVAVARGEFRRENTRVELVDLPGTYALNGSSEDERIAAGYIEAGEADCIVVVCDGTSLERNLILAIQILQRTQSVILCVNLMDEARKRGYRPDARKLSAALGIPVVFTAAGRKEGLNELKTMLAALQDLNYCPKVWTDPVKQAAEIANECVSREKTNENWRIVLDRLLMGRRHGVMIMLGMIFVIVWITVWGANYPSAGLEWIFGKCYTLFHQWMIHWPVWLRGIVLDGIYATASRVLAVMLPPMAIFFPLFTLLEDMGYLPRMAYLLDGAMEKCGGSGRQALTMCMGLGCNAVGVTGCRIIDAPRERYAATVTNAMIPCNGRFPTLVILAGMLCPPGLDGVCVGLIVILGVLGAMLTSALIHGRPALRESSPFLMELPPFRRPRTAQIMIRSLLDRTLRICGRALMVAAPAGALLWILANTPALSHLSGLLDGAGQFLGMNGAVLLAFLLSIPANELFLPILVLIATGEGSVIGVEGIHPESILSVYPAQTLICMMLFTVFHWPCATTLQTIYRETGSKRKTAVAFILPTAVGILLCMIIRLLM